jgi:signal transduction histidine kinase
VDRARNLFLGMLGHDMRTPLQAIQMTASYLGALNAGDKVSEAASRLINSGGRMQALLDDLVEFNRIKLGLGIAVHPANFDVAALFADELEELRAAYPGRQLELQVTGQTRSFLDGPRVQRLLGNLVVNALKYGAQDAPVRVVLTADEAGVRFQVRNSGLALDPLTLEQLFEPLKRGAQQEDRYSRDGSLGLGLYIAREIARAHGGEIEARSEVTETVFAVRLPR